MVLSYKFISKMFASVAYYTLESTGLAILIHQTDK